MSSLQICLIQKMLLVYLCLVLLEIHYRQEKTNHTSLFYQIMELIMNLRGHEMKVLFAESCPTLHNSLDCSPPGFCCPWNS